MKQLIDFFEKIEIKTVLDLGTGSGDFIKVLKDVFPAAKIIGADPHVESLEKARRKYSDVVLMEMAAEKLEFPDNTFDVASISMALHHLPDIQTSLNEMQRVVKPGGWIIVSELFSDNLNPAQEVHKMFHHFRSSTDRLLGVSHNETFKKDEIIEMVEKSGIKIQTHFEVNKETNLTVNLEELEMRAEQMKEMLDAVKEFPEYEGLKPQIKEFRERAAKYGFQSATRVVIIGKVG